MSQEEKRYGAGSDGRGGFHIGYTLAQLAENLIFINCTQELAIELLEAKEQIKDLESKCSLEGGKALKDSLESAWGTAMKQARKERDVYEEDHIEALDKFRKAYPEDTFVNIVQAVDFVLLDVADLSESRERDMQEAYETGLMQREGPDELSEEHTAAWYRIEDRLHSNTIDNDLDNDIRILMHALTTLRDRLAVRSEKLQELWMLLDNIDTLDDACRNDDATFHNLTRIQQRKRFEIWNPEKS